MLDYKTQGFGYKQYYECTNKTLTFNMQHFLMETQNTLMTLKNM